MKRAVRQALEKSRDSGLLAVEVYNKPAVKFKSAAYVTLMVIAWTALFHAIFFKRRIKPYYRKAKSSKRFERVDGDYKHWELRECLFQYFESESGNPIRKNLEFFIGLRNKIEHRSVPEIDSAIFGECQAMLLNFDEILQKEFGGKYCLRECLSFALQMYPSAEGLGEAVKKNPAAKSAAGFVEQYRSSITADVLGSSKFSFKAFLIEVANHPGKGTLAIQFVNWDKLNEEQRHALEKVVIAIKPKNPSVANADTMRAGVVCEKVNLALGSPTIQRGKKQVQKFNPDWHTRCWRDKKVRPPGGSPNPEKTNALYCVYDKRHNDYGYTAAWVELLITEFRDPAKYESLYPKEKKAQPEGGPRPDGGPGGA